MRLPISTMFSVSFTDPGLLFSKLQNLTTIDMDRWATVDISLYIRSLTQCPKLVELRLNHPQLDGDHLCQLLPGLPRLAGLRITGRLVRSLRCFTIATHLARTLRVLQLHGFVDLPPTALFHLRGLAALRDLTIVESMTEPLDALTVASLTPEHPLNSALGWPPLTKLNYAPRRLDEEEEEPQEE